MKKLTTEQRKLVKEYISKLVNKRSLKEATSKKLKLVRTSNWKSMIGADPGYDKLTVAQVMNLKNYLEANYSVQEIAKAIDNYKTTPFWLLPSGWPQNGPGYPAFLAKALNMSSAAEPASDIGNIYYLNRNISPEARKEFFKEMIKNPKQAFGKHNNADGLALLISGDTSIENVTKDEFYADQYMCDYMKAPEIKKFIEKFYPQFI